MSICPNASGCFTGTLVIVIYYGAIKFYVADLSNEGMPLVEFDSTYS